MRYINLKKRYLPLAFLLGISGGLFANNLAITNLSYNGGNQTVTFNVSWENSWRNTGIPGSTVNYDGAWIFIKFRDACAKDSVSPSAGDYQHMWLSTTPADHTVPAGGAIEIGTTTIGGNPRGMGVFLYRAADGTGTFTLTNVTLKWDITAQGLTGTDWDIQVFGMEMVRIPQGSYFLGDGVSQQSFREGITLDPFLISSEGAVTLGNAAGQLNHISNANTSSNLTGSLAAGFPKGHDAFWVMKYEVTQKQYCDFLNTLSRANQAVAAPNSAAALNVGNTSATANQRGAFTTWSTQVSNRNGIRIAGPVGNVSTPVDPSKPVVFENDLNQDNPGNSPDDGASIACNYLTPTLLFYYLDWAALRPMNELEYEKICRGPSVSPPYVLIGRELVWGLPANVASNYTYVATNTLFLAGQSSEVANVTGTGLVVANVTSAPLGPRRVGMTYTSATDRATSGSSYYGVADMAGNVEELVIRLTTGNNAQPAYTRDSYGDGMIGSAFSSLDWPVSWVPTQAGVTGKGGAWNTVGSPTIPDQLQISTRFSDRVSNVSTTVRPQAWRGACTSTTTCSSTDPNTATNAISLGGRGVR
jgi:formylglycine-generating enzyme required for sulfatase activity